jgi:hypothetical protein
MNTQDNKKPDEKNVNSVFVILVVVKQESVATIFWINEFSYFV